MESFVKTIVVPAVLAVLIFALTQMVDEMSMGLSITVAVVAGLILAALSLKYWRSGNNLRSKFSSQAIHQEASLGESLVIDSTVIQGNIVENMHITIDGGAVKRSPTVEPIADYDKRNAQVQNAQTQLSIETGHLDPDEAKDSAKAVVRARIKEAIALLDRRSFEQARKLLRDIHSDIKGRAGFERERARVLNNMGVSYNQPGDDAHHEDAVVYFKLAQIEDPTLRQPKLNLAMLYLTRNTKAAIEEGHDTIFAVWSSTENKQRLPQKELEALVGAAMWAEYIHKGAESSLSFLESLQETTISAALDTWAILHHRASMCAEVGRLQDALSHCKAGLAKEPESPELLALRARLVLAIEVKDGSLMKGLDLVPVVGNLDSVKNALAWFQTAASKSQEQKKMYLLPEIHIGIVQCVILLDRFDEAPDFLRLLDSVSLPDHLKQHLDVLKYTTQMQRREFEAALHTLRQGSKYEQVTYEERKLLARRFAYRGAPEQAVQLLSEIEEAATTRKDFDYWLDLALNYVLLGRKLEAIAAANRAKVFADVATLTPANRRIFMSYYSTIQFRYIVGIGKDAENRLLPALIDFQKEFPDENIVVPVKALDEHGNLTDDFKGQLLSQQKAATELRDSFKASPVPTYVLVHETGRSFVEFICVRLDPEFTIEFTVPEQTFESELLQVYKDARVLLFDYLSLLDLSKVGLLGYLERMGKRIAVHKSLFDEIQNDLTMREYPELRVLWEFLRKSKSVEFISDSRDANFAIGEIGEHVDEWLAHTLAYSKSENVPLVTDDLRLLRFIKSEQMIGMNIVPIISQLREQGHLDKPAYSTVIGGLAERFYVFLAFDHEDLSTIVFADDYKVTPRSFHLVNQIVLRGSDWRSFVQVFVRFIKRLWSADVLPSDKIAWLGVLTQRIVFVVEREIVEGKQVDTKPLAVGLSLMWRNAIDEGCVDDLKDLEPEVDKMLDNKKYPDITEHFKKYISARLQTLRADEH